MDILESIEEYTLQIKDRTYIYRLQQLGISLFKEYIIRCNLNRTCNKIDSLLLERFVLVWLPRNRKYLSQSEVYQIIYTIHDFKLFMESKINNSSKTQDSPTILELYGEAYMRVYKARNLLSVINKDPVISVHPLVIDIEKYRVRRSQREYKEPNTMYRQGLFIVGRCKEGGETILQDYRSRQCYETLIEYPAYKYLREGDLLQAVIKKRIFCIYWEIQEVKVYYLPEASKLL